VGVSGVTDPTEVTESIGLVAGIPDSRIEDELVRTEGQRSGVIFMTLGEPNSPLRHGLGQRYAATPQDWSHVG
jgi:hypothetical protein